MRQAVFGRAGQWERSPNPSRALNVNPAVARRRRSNLPREKLQPPQGTETAHRAEGPAALQAEDPGTDATDARNQSGTNAEGTDGLFTRLEELLWLLSDTFAAKGSG